MEPLAFDNSGDFKILQLADLHFSNEEGKCRDIPVDVKEKERLKDRQFTVLVI